MATRSRNGCKTCRARKLKCDQNRPICNNCRKSNKQCVQSEPVAFRHQQNAGLGGDADENSLSSFFKYRQGFTEVQRQAFLPVAPQLIFVYVTDVYATDDHDIIATQASLTANAQYAAQQAAHSGLNALSDAAGQYQPAANYEPVYSPLTGYSQLRGAANSGNGQQHNNIGFLLNPANNTPSSMIDPNLEVTKESDVAAVASTEPHEIEDEEVDETAQQVALALKSMG